jgi:RHS repeat-associated protein
VASPVSIAWRRVRRWRSSRSCAAAFWRSERSFFVNDPIGTPDELVGADGKLLGELDRKAWGRIEAVDVARAATPVGFQGQHEDFETGLFYNRHRYYDPDAGLYLSPDPIGLEGGLRPFGYVVNPTGWVDPLGLTGGPYDIGPHDAQPSPRPNGLESHHIVQGAWARQNVPGYNYSNASAMLVPKQEHQVITKGQNARQAARECAGRGAWPSTPREELNGIASDYDGAGIDEKHKRRAIKSAYKLMVP